jgi:hypothetical protein
MDAERDAVPDDVAALKQALAVERAKGLEIAAELAVAPGESVGRRGADRICTGTAGFENPGKRRW